MSSMDKVFLILILVGGKFPEIDSIEFVFCVFVSANTLTTFHSHIPNS